MNRRALTLLSGLGLAALLSGASLAQEKPTLTLVVPTTSATAGDIIARLIAPHLAERLKRTVVVENKSGASGMIGMQFVARAKPDGNTVLVGPNSLLTMSGLNKNLPFNVKTDFLPVVPLAVSTMAVITSPEFQAKNLNEFVQTAKRNPTKLNYGSPGIGTPHHLLMEVFKEGQGINVTHVPFKGTAGMVNDMAGGRVDIAFMPLHTSVELAKAGKVRVVAIVGDKRSSLFPDVPTVTEQGFKSERFTWTAGVFLPPGTPRPIVQELEEAIIAILNMPSTEKALAAAGLTPVPESSQEFSRRYVSEIDKWRKIVDMAGIKPE